MSEQSNQIDFKISHPAKNPLLIALFAGIGAAICIGILAIIDETFKGDYVLIAPFGATMVLVFAVPQSPLSQPRNVICGHLVTALVGLVFANFLPINFWSLGLAVGVGIFLMIVLKIIHPPAGGNPLLIMLGGHTSFMFALYPILTGTCLIVLMALIYHGFVSRLEYSWVNKTKKE